WQGRAEQGIHAPGHFTDMFRYSEPGWEGDAALEKWQREIEEEEFDLERGPLLYLHLLRRSERDFCCVLKMHHIISDGWSMRLILNELTRYYEVLAGGGEATPARLGIQYKDYAYWQEKQLEAGLLKDHRHYW